MGLQPVLGQVQAGQRWVGEGAEREGGMVGRIRREDKSTEGKVVQTRLNKNDAERCKNRRDELKF